MRLKTVILLACLCVLTVSVQAQNQSPAAYGNITATASDCTVTPAACVSLHFPYSNTGVVGIQVTGTWVATLAAQGSSDNQATWFTVNMTPYSSSTPVSSTAANGNWQAFVGGLTDFRIRASAYTSGTAIVVLNSTSAVGAGAVEVPGSTTAGTSSANGIPGTPMMCDSANSGTVTQGQAQMVRCKTDGSLSVGTGSLGLADGNGNTVNTPSTAGNGQINYEVNPIIFNGTSWDRFRSASLASFPAASTLTARNSIGAAIVEKGSRWSVNSTPAVSTQASASIAAEALVRHVADSVCFSAGATTAPALTNLQINIRDGATGAGTILASFQVVIPATAVQHLAPTCITGLQLVGTTNTAMTAEWSALLTNEFEQVTITGSNVN